MRQADGHKNNGKTRTAFSNDGLRLFHSPKHFFCLLFLTHFLPRDNGAVWLSHFAVNLFAPQSIARPKQIKSLQFPSHFFGFFKTVLAIPKHSTFVFAKRQAKINKLCCLPSQIGVLCTFSGHLAPLSQKPKPQAFGFISFCNDT